MRSLIERAAAVMFVVLAASVGIVVATAMMGAGSKGARRVARRIGIAVFAHHSIGTAHTANDGSLKLPPGAILASTADHAAIYLWHNSRGEDCVIDLHIGGQAGVATCTPASRVEEEGAVQVSLEGRGATAPGSAVAVRVSALVPDGVRSVTFTSHDGSSDRVPVTNNVAVHEDVHAASVSYVLPGERTRTTDVATVVDHVPRRPGSVDSGRAAHTKLPH